MLTKTGKVVVCLVAGGLLVALCASYGRAAGQQTIQARLSGFQEVPANVSPGEGTFEARVVGDTIEFTFEYSNLTATPTVAHIHLAQRGVNGGVFTFLCGGGTKPEACPAAPATIEGTITAADIQAVTAQGLAAGDIATAIRAIRHGVTYVNVHTPTFPAGEIRGQVRPDLNLTGFDG